MAILVSKRLIDILYFTLSYYYQVKNILLELILYLLFSYYLINTELVLIKFVSLTSNLFSNPTEHVVLVETLAWKEQFGRTVILPVILTAVRALADR